ncbi:ROK family protein [Spiroplasma diminutum]|uniref:Glucokinase n=1 Tax=Spiroplasma diminutum CUAS-1 TaxID=1276221 RepID=S5MEE8_9MOLU|nr:ROK family protein [Spiroplasma diminutum]AGR42118.1 glucokinase [Spiroplasma diminutum CUAS-1]
MKLVLAIEIGVTSSKVGLVNQYGDLQAKFAVDHDLTRLIPNLFEKIIDGLEAIGINYEEEVEKIGIAIGGYVDHMLGIIRYSANLNLTNYHLKEVAEELFKKPIFVINDANASALGEFWTGVAKQYDSIIFYYVDNGIGGAVITEGKLAPGARGFAGEFGHGGGVFQKNYPCSCGLTGCVEPMSSILGIANHFKVTFKNKKNHSAAHFFKNVEDITFKEILEIYEENNQPEEITVLLQEALDPLIMHMATMINALDPEAIILAGGLTQLDEKLIEIIQSSIKKYMIDMFAEELTIEIAELGNDSTMIGSAYYALNDWKIF